MFWEEIVAPPDVGRNGGLATRLGMTLSPLDWLVT